MLISPHKKRKRTTLPTTTAICPSVGDAKKSYIAVWPFKKQRSDYAGNNGNKYKKRGDRAQQPKGLPRGKCIRDPQKCRCGGHNKPGNKG